MALEYKPVEPGITASTAKLPLPLYTAEQTRRLDQWTIQYCGVSGYELMQRAAQAAFRCGRQRWPKAKRWLVACGGGNNAGDGYLVALLAHQAGFQVAVGWSVDPDILVGDAQLAYEAAVAGGVTMGSWQTVSQALEIDLVIDAFFGTGLNRNLSEFYLDAIQQIQKCKDAGAGVFALDIPSGLCADSGREWGGAVSADLTLSFIGLNRGLFTGQGKARCGQVFFAGLGVPEVAYEAVPADAYRASAALRDRLLPSRSPTAHKGQCGHVVLLGGARGLGGAIIMAAEAAACSGSGLVSVVTDAQHVAPLLTRRPELMSLAWDDVDLEAVERLAALMERATLLVIGPGLGTETWGIQLLQQALDSGLPLVLDADALNLLANKAVSLPNSSRRRWIMTPHPGEAARLLQCSVADIEQNRFAAAAELAESFNSIVLLKGAGTLIAVPRLPSPSLPRAGVAWLSDRGNPGMASGGMGDILSGVIGGIWAQTIHSSDCAEVAALGAWVHGCAGDAAAQQGERGMLATDLLAAIRGYVNGDG